MCLSNLILFYPQIINNSILFFHISLLVKTLLITPIRLHQQSPNYGKFNRWYARGCSDPCHNIILSKPPSILYQLPVLNTNLQNQNKICHFKIRIANALPPYTFLMDHQNQPLPLKFKNSFLITMSNSYSGINSGT